MVKKVVVVSPRGFCAGVARAIRAVEDAVELFGVPVYVKHAIVHNTHVVDDLTRKGAITVDDLSQVPDGATVIFSAHGSPPEHYTEARRRGMRIVDATCPLVTKVHLEMRRYIQEGYTVLYIGHKGHVEGMGVMAEAEGIVIPFLESVEDVESLDIKHQDNIVYLTQTTLSKDETRAIIEALRRKYPHIIEPPIEDICYATTNRQEAVKALAKRSDLVLVVGSESSSNSQRLADVAVSCGVRAHRINDVSEIQTEWLDQVETVGVTAGASAPEYLVRAVVDFFVSQGAKEEYYEAKSERMVFSEPLELMQARHKEN